MATVNDLLNTQGVLYGSMDALLAEATEKLQTMPDSPTRNDVQRAISNAHKLVEQAGLFNQEVWDMVNKKPTPQPQPNPTPQPPPEPVEPDFTGSLDPMSLSPIDLAFYQDKAMGPISGKIFSGNRTRLNKWIERDYEQRKAVTGAMLVNYVGPLKKWEFSKLEDF